MSPLAIAAIRAIFGAFVLAGAAFFGQLATGGTTHAASIAAGVAFFSALALRFGVEGVIDQVAQNKRA